MSSVSKFSGEKVRLLVDSDVSLKSSFMARQLLLLNSICFCKFLDSSQFFKEPAGIICHAFEAFSRDWNDKFSSYNYLLPIRFYLE